MEPGVKAGKVAQEPIILHHHTLPVLSQLYCEPSTSYMRVANSKRVLGWVQPNGDYQLETFDCIYQSLEDQLPNNTQ